MLSESKIRNFLCLANTLSFTEASKKLFITQQALSKQMSQLESEVGATLFERSSKGVTLTENGRICYDMFLRFMTEYDNFLLRLKEELSISTLSLGFQNWSDLSEGLGRASRCFEALMPSFSVNVGCYSLDGLLTKLEEGELDIVLLHERFLPDDETIKKRVLLQTPMAIMVSAKHPLATDTATAETFSHEPFISFALERETQAESFARTKSTIAKYKLSPRSVKVVPNSESVVAEIELGNGIGIMPAIFNRQISNKNVKVYQTEISMPLMCVWRKTDLRRETELFVECLVKEI